MTSVSQTPAEPSKKKSASAKPGRKVHESDDFRAKIYKAMSVQRPVVLELLKSLRRENPDATAAEILGIVEKRYVAAVTISSTGVGVAAAIPAVGIPLALGLGVVDLLFFYELSAIYVLAAAELQGIAVTDAERARPLVFGMLLGPKSQNKIMKLVFSAAGIDIDIARDAAEKALGKVLPEGWAEVLLEQLPDSALAPLATTIARDAIKQSAKFSVGTAGKVIPFGVGAVIGGVGSFYFGRDVVKAQRIAFAAPPTEFPDVLADFTKPRPEILRASLAATAIQSAAGSASDMGVVVWGKASDVVNVFRSVDLDGDGVPDEARAVSAAKRAGSAIRDAASDGIDAVGSFVKKPKSDGLQITE